jgi:arginine exporter protein ArgO
VSAFLAGVIAGFGVAVPLGAIGVLLVQEGISNGWRTARAGGAGVALVDFGYAAVAVTAGAAVSQLLVGREHAVRSVGAVVLAVVVVRGLLALRRAAPGTEQAAPTGSPLQVLCRFVALTAINPLTALYFVVLTAGLGRQVSRPAAATAFVAGVFLASLAWQLLLTGVASVTGTRMPPWTRTVTSLVGYTVVAGYAIRLAAT